jgi:hypothetical protein
MQVSDNSRNITAHYPRVNQCESLIAAAILRGLIATQCGTNFVGCAVCFTCGYCILCFSLVGGLVFATGSRFVIGSDLDSIAFFPYRLELLAGDEDRLLVFIILSDNPGKIESRSTVRFRLWSARPVSRVSNMASMLEYQDPAAFVGTSRHPSADTPHRACAGDRWQTDGSLEGPRLSRRGLSSSRLEGRGDEAY